MPDERKTWPSPSGPYALLEFSLLSFLGVRDTTLEQAPGITCE